MTQSTSRTAGRRALLALSASFATISFAAPVVAQEADESEARQETIVVTAQFREQNLQDTPLSITAASAEMMEARSQTSVIEVAGQAPNVSLTPAGGAYGPSITAFIRGVGQNDFNPAYEPGVGMYIDDVYYPTLTGANFDLLDLERVEILRGPQGTLTGRNSIGGAVKLVSRRPDGGNEGYVEGSFGSRDLMEFRGSADFKVTDTLFGRISGVHKQQEGFVTRYDYGCMNPNNPEGIASIRSQGDCASPDLFGGEGYSGTRAMLRWTPNDKLDINLSADYSTIDRTPSADVLVYSTNPNFLCGDDCNYTDFAGPATRAGDPRVLFEGWGTSLNVDYDINDKLQLQSISAYRRYTTQWYTDDDFSPIAPASGAAGYNDMDHWFVSQEVRLNASLNDIVDFTVGGYFSDQNTTYYTRQDIGYIVPGVPLQFYGNDPVNADSYAAFGTVIISPTEAMNITAGVRYTNETKDYTFVRKDYQGGSNVGFGVAALDGLTAEYEGDKVDYRISLDYRFTDAVLAYGTISTGFKGGGVSARPFTATQATNGTFDPEELTAYEVGVKTDILGGAGRVNVSAFYNKYTEIQIPIADCSAIDGFAGAPCGARINGGDSDFWGLEGEFSANLSNGLMLDASLSYINGEWKSVDARAPTIQVGDSATSPDWRGSLGIQYVGDMGDRGTLTPRLDLVYTGERSGGRPAYLAGDELLWDAYTLANARVTWTNANDDLDVSLAVLNLTDEEYTVQQFNAVSAFAGTAYDTLSEPREWKVTVKKKF